MNFFEELKRRNVVRVGIAYLVAAWLLIQFSDILLDNMEAPAWVLQVIMMVLAIGFIVTLFVAWAFELTPEGVKREAEVDRSQSITPRTGKKLNNLILVLMALAIAYLLFDKFAGQPPARAVVNPVPSHGGAAEEEVEDTAADRRSIAVLPFTNRSRLAEDEFFVDGIHDDLLTNLARIGALKVISRTSVNRYRGTDKSIPEIAAELGVATVMEGAVQRAGNQVRINVQLIDAQTDEHLWAEIFDRQLTTDNLFAIQSEISERIATELEATLTPSEQQRINDRPTENLAAYDAFLRGRQAMAERTAEGSDRALEEFQRAVELDPDFALAWAGIAQSTLLAFDYSDMKLDEALRLTREASDRALALDDQLGEAHLARAQQLALERGRTAEREQAYRKAVELSPGYAEAWNEYSDFLDDFPNRIPEALEMAQRSANLDPLSDIVQNQLISVLIVKGHFQEAEQRLQGVIAKNPDFAPNYLLMSNLKADMGQLDQAIMWRRKAQALDPGNINMVLSEVWLLTSLGMDPEIDRLVARIEEMDPNSSTLAFVELVIQVYRQHFDAALESAHWYGQKIPSRPGAGDRAAYIVHMMKGDASMARRTGESFLSRFAGGETRQSALEANPEHACPAAWVLYQSGDEEPGLALSRATVRYVEDELPGYVDRAPALDTEICHALEGNAEAALQSIENAVRAGDFLGWWMVIRHPANAQLRHEPRFQAAVAAIERRMATQRENLSRLLEEIGP
jgi:TolB-like protein/Tfp pilus assembly protein PilF